MWYTVGMGENNLCRYCNQEVDYVKYCCFACYKRHHREMSGNRKARKINDFILSLLNKIWRKLKWIM